MRHFINEGAHTANPVAPACTNGARRYIRQQETIYCPTYGELNCRRGRELQVSGAVKGRRARSGWAWARAIGVPMRVTPQPQRRVRCGKPCPLTARAVQHPPASKPALWRPRTTFGPAKRRHSNKTSGTFICLAGSVHSHATTSHATRNNCAQLLSSQHTRTGSTSMRLIPVIN